MGWGFLKLTHWAIVSLSDVLLSNYFCYFCNMQSACNCSENEESTLARIAPLTPPIDNHTEEEANTFSRGVSRGRKSVAKLKNSEAAPQILDKTGYFSALPCCTTFLDSRRNLPLSVVTMVFSTRLLLLESDHLGGII